MPPQSRRIDNRLQPKPKRLLGKTATFSLQQGVWAGSRKGAAGRCLLHCPSQGIPGSMPARSRFFFRQAR